MTRKMGICALAALAIACGDDDGGIMPTDAGTTPRVDAGSTPSTDGGAPEVDAGSTPGTDAGTPGIDAGSMPEMDAGSTPGTDAGTPGIDAGSMAEMDAGSTPGTDGGPPGIDAGSMPSTDAGTTGVDAGTTTPGTDAGETRDPRLTSDPDPMQVACGTATCNTSSQVCCTSLRGQMCTMTGGCMGLFATSGACDGQEDCPGQRCCAPSSMSTLSMGTTCAATCGTGRIELCGVDGDCDPGQQCLTCRPNTGPTGPMLFYGVCVASTARSCPSPFMNP